LRLAARAVGAIACLLPRVPDGTRREAGGAWRARCAGAASTFVASERCGHPGRRCQYRTGPPGRQRDTACC